MKHELTIPQVPEGTPKEHNHNPLIKEFREKFSDIVKNFWTSGSLDQKRLEQFLLEKVEESRIALLEQLLGMKREAYNEKEALSPMLIVSRTYGDGIPPFTDETVRQLQYVKVFDIERLLKEEKELLARHPKNEQV